jgi:hypothetical protein
MHCISYVLTVPKRIKTSGYCDMIAASWNNGANRCGHW